MILKQLEFQGSRIPEYVIDKSCARCAHNRDTGNPKSLFCQEAHCDVDNHKINYIESFSITCDCQKGKDYENT